EWTRRGKRDELIALTGQPDAPVVLFDDGTALAGSRAIKTWAVAHPASTTTRSSADRPNHGSREAP
ncbi:MAG: hypothetical protein WAQ33_00845, partial [Gaiellaceae bacterium]